MRLSFLDFGFATMETEFRKFDFSCNAKLRRPVDVKTLNLGAQRAFRIYPKSACRIRRNRWVPEPQPWSVQMVTVNSQAERIQFIQGVLQRPIQLEQKRGLEQHLICVDADQYLLTRFHHAVADGVSLLLWLNAQLNKDAQNKELAESVSPIPLRRQSDSKMTSPYSFARPCETPTMAEHQSLRRGWTSVLIDKTDFRELNGHFTYNDFLAAAILKSLRTSGMRLGLYMPVNIREKPLEGFGNGASRIRVYHDGNRDISVADLAAEIRQQVRWSRENGVWNIPAIAESLPRLPRILSVPLLRRYAYRTNVDMGSMLFSHMEKLPYQRELFEKVESLEFIAPLHRKHSMAIVATAEGSDHTRITITWDDAQLSAEHRRDFQTSLENNLKVLGSF